MKGCEASGGIADDVYVVAAAVQVGGIPAGCSAADVRELLSGAGGVLVDRLDLTAAAEVPGAEQTQVCVRVHVCVGICAMRKISSVEMGVYASLHEVAIAAKSCCTATLQSCNQHESAGLPTYQHVS